MEDRDRELFALIEPHVTSMGLDLVEVGLIPGGRGNVLRVVIHAVRGVTLGDCARVTRGLGPVLDASELPGERYVMEVSSPGTDRVLKEPREFDVFRGAPVRVFLESGGREISGLVGGRSGEAVVVRTEDGGESFIPWSSVTKARLVPEKPDRAPAGGREQ